MDRNTQVMKTVAMSIIYVFSRACLIPGYVPLAPTSFGADHIPDYSDMVGCLRPSIFAKKMRSAVSPGFGDVGGGHQIQMCAAAVFRNGDLIVAGAGESA